MPRARVSRRRVVLLVLLLGIVLEGMIAVAVMAQDEEKPTLNTALPLHPVAGNFKPDGTKLADCASQACTEQAFGNIAYRRGPKVALARFDEKYGDFSDPNCHRVAHRIGSASLARNRGDVANTFAQGSSSCFSGYYHGVLEHSLLQVKSYDPISLGNVVRGLCEGAQMNASVWLKYQCLHGLGHGLMITTGYDLPLSLKVCDRLTTPWETTSCNGGAFMENISNFFGVTSRWLRDDDPVYPCDWVKQGDKLKCYEIVTSHILRVNGASWPKAAETCANVEKGWTSACFRSLGRDSAGQAHEDPEGITKLCAVARQYGGEEACVMGAAEAMTGNFKTGQQAANLCRTVSSNLRAGCYYGIGSVMSMYGPTSATRKAHCRGVTTASRYVAACMRAGTDFQRKLNATR
jgi:hypothetical protein